MRGAEPEGGREPQEAAGLFRARTPVSRPAQFLLPPEMHERLRLRAFQERVSMSEVVRQALDAWLGE